MILSILHTIDPTNVKRNDSRVSRYSRVCRNDSRTDSRYSFYSRVSHKWKNMMKPPLI